MKKAADFHTFKRLKNMSFNDFNRWINEFYRAAFDDGRKFGNEEIEEYYRKGAETYTYEELFDLLVSVRGISPRIAETAMDRIMPDIVEDVDEG